MAHLSINLSLYWLIVPVTALLLWWLVATEREDRGGYLSGIATLLVFGACIAIFCLVLASLVMIHLYILTHP